MTIYDVKVLIASDESRTLELNKTTGELKDGMHAACAFLNTEGGWQIFGIAPKSLKIIGQQVTDDTLIRHWQKMLLSDYIQTSSNHPKQKYLLTEVAKEWKSYNQNQSKIQ